MVRPLSFSVAVNVISDLTVMLSVFDTLSICHHEYDLLSQSYGVFTNDERIKQLRLKLFVDFRGVNRKTYSRVATVPNMLRRRIASLGDAEQRVDFSSFHWLVIFVSIYFRLRWRICKGKLIGVSKKCGAQLMKSGKEFRAAMYMVSLFSVVRSAFRCAKNIWSRPQPSSAKPRAAPPFSFARLSLSTRTDPPPKRSSENNWSVWAGCTRKKLRTSARREQSREKNRRPRRAARLTVLRDGIDCLPACRARSMDGWRHLSC